VLQIEGLNQYYGESHTLWDMDLAVPEGQVTCLMGRNGVGKTTLLKAIMGLLPARSGAIRLGDTDLLKQPAEARARLGVGYVPQGREIFPLLTVEENLRVALGASDRKTLPELVYDLFPVLKEMRRRRGGDLSGGQQQQLAIGRALVLDPHLLILDEPTEGIQPNIVHEIGEVLRYLNRELALTVLVVEQKLNFARQVGDHFCIMDRGQRVATGPMGELDDQLIQTHLTV
jgi:urea transport system ATP-binding protein